MSASTRDNDVAELLLERQAKGLRVPIVARITFGLFGFFAALFGKGIPWNSVLLIGVINVVMISLLAYLFVQLGRRRHVDLIGWIGVGADIGSMAIYPYIQKLIFANLGLEWVYIIKAPFSLVCITFIAINALALHPKYPTVVGIAAIFVYSTLMVLGQADPNVSWTVDFKAQFTGPAISLGLAVGQICFMALITLGLYFLTKSARKTVKEAVTRQAERTQLVREHAESVMEGRIDALRNLVASLSHEMNTPLGAVKSASATLGSATKKLASQIDAGLDKRTERLLGLIEETARIPELACDRLESMLQRLTAFAHLDASELSDVDVNVALDRTLSLIPTGLIGESLVVRDYGAKEPIRVAPARLNLALMTVLTNAFEANQGKGEVRIRTKEVAAKGRASSLVIEIADQGPGIAEESKARIFDIRIDDTAGRIKAGLGLPAAYSSIKKHGGDIVLKKESEGGACFQITLPYP